MSLDISFPRGNFLQKSLGSTPVDISTQATFGEGDAFYVAGVQVNFLAPACQGCVVEFRASAGGATTFFTVRKDSPEGVPQNINLSHWSFYAAAGLECLAGTSAAADVAVVFYDPGVA